ncbi:MAG: type IV toxin-antitoxin system AbiEi family antitoxin domain-containing protein [Terracoccus sp.]
MHDRRLDALVKGQGGLVTRRQAVAAGMSPKAIRCRVDSGRWVRLHAGVYLTVPGRDDWTTTAVAALLSVGLPSALSGRSAGYAWGLLRSPGEGLEITVPPTRMPDPLPGVVVRRRRHAVERTHETAWPHRTTAEHTVLDLVEGASVDETVALVARACQQWLTTPQRLEVALADRPSQPGRSLLLEILGDVAGGVESSAERRYLRDVERAHGLPVGVMQQPGPGSTARDNTYRDVFVIVEIDGRAGHAGWRAQQRDGRRDRRNAAGSWLTIRGFWPDVCGGQCAFALELEAIFRSRGWTGRARPCRSRGCAVRLRDAGFGPP